MPKHHDLGGGGIKGDLDAAIGAAGDRIAGQLIGLDAVQFDLRTVAAKGDDGVLAVLGNGYIAQGQFFAFEADHIAQREIGDPVFAAVRIKNKDIAAMTAGQNIIVAVLRFDIIIAA